MAKEKINYFSKVSVILHKLHEDYPTFSIARHISTALSEYKDIWDVSNKELLFALEKYTLELSLDSDNLCGKEYVDNIVKDGIGLFDTKDDLSDLDTLENEQD